MPGNVEAIGYKDALSRIRNLRDTFKSLDGIDRSRGNYFWLNLFILALCAQERMIAFVNDELIASDIPWEKELDIPLISSTVGDAASYAERIKDPVNQFLKALLLSFSGWTLLSTDKRECACGNGKLREVSVDVLAQTSLKITETKSKCLYAEFLIGVQSDDQDHLEHHYSFKKQSVRHDNLIIIFSSVGEIYKSEMGIYEVTQDKRDFQQAEQFRTNKMAEILNGLICSFDGVIA